MGVGLLRFFKKVKNNNKRLALPLGLQGYQVVSLVPYVECWKLDYSHAGSHPNLVNIGEYI